MKLLKKALICMAVLVSVGGLSAEKRLVLVLDLSDSMKIRRDWKQFQQNLGGTPVDVPHITLFGQLPLSKEREIIQAVSDARENFKNKNNFDKSKGTRIYIDFNNKLQKFGRFTGVKVNKVYIKEAGKELKFDEFINEIAEKLKNKKINNDKKSSNGYHVSVVKNKSKDGAIVFPASLYIRCLALYKYDDKGAGEFSKVTDFFFKKDDRNEVKTLRKNLKWEQPKVEAPKKTETKVQSKSKPAVKKPVVRPYKQPAAKPVKKSVTKKPAVRKPAAEPVAKQVANVYANKSQIPNTSGTYYVKVAGGLQEWQVINGNKFFMRIIKK